MRDAARDLMIPFDACHPDARLIESAPDLLMAARHFPACELAGSSLEFRCKECVAGRAAIAKAEGR
jgi:hypothetical protein